MLFQLLVVVLVNVFAWSQATVSLWPLPSSFTFGEKSLSLSNKFTFQYSGQNSIVVNGINRYLNLIHKAQGSTISTGLTSCSVTVTNDKTVPAIIGSDESYKISVTDAGVCGLTANTVWGALRGLETFTQLLSGDANNVVSIENTPVTITDVPRYGHRGILIDTARHYEPISEIQRIIDSLPTNKFNVLHWHIIDAESFPFDSKSEPTMIQGAFSPSMIYSAADLKSVHDYAAERGVELIMELDVPGHAASWTKGKVSVMADCFAKYYYNINDFALNPALDETYTTVNNIISDMISATGSKYIHLGGDEVVYGCWKNDTSVVNFYNSMGYTSYDQVLDYFVQKVDGFVTSQLGVTVTHWEEVFTANVKVPAGTRYQVWTDSSKVSQVTAAKYPVIASPSNYWYLNVQTNTWQNMYAYDPTVNLTSSQADYIIGGEAALWSEYIDETNIEVNIYPRASAVAERLWSPKSVTNQTDAQNRLVIQKCRLVNRGFKSTPVMPADYCSKTYI